MATWTGTLPGLLGLQVPTATQWQEITGALKALTGAWTNHVATWTAATTNPNIGNGTIFGSYFQAGKLVVYTGRILMGSTTTFGSGMWQLSLPVTAVNTIGPAGACAVSDASTSSNRMAAVAYLSSTTKLSFWAGDDVTGTNPFSWASSDTIRWLIMYEAA